MTPEEARIVAHVCGDGWVSTSTENCLQIVKGRRYTQRRKRYYVGYCNTDKILLQEFSADLKTVYGISSRTSGKTAIKTQSKRVFDRVTSLGAGSSYEWFIGTKIINASKKVKRAWLRAFFDDEGTVSFKPRQIRIKNMNRTGLLQVQELVSSLGIESRFTGPNCDNSFYLSISKASEIIKFSKIIDFNHSEKSQKLEKLKREILARFGDDINTKTRKKK